MADVQSAPYGSWKSPISSELIVSETIMLGSPALDGEDVYWLEGRPQEGGRQVLVRRTPDGSTADVTPAPYNVRSRVHEYGGGAYTVHEGMAYFVNFVDQRLYAMRPGEEPRAITPEGKLRYADSVVDARRGRLICVREDHTESDLQPVNTLVSVKLSGDAEGGRVLVSGNDFYSTPRLSPDGSRLVWLTWNHPNMPWDGTELWVGDIAEDGGITNARRVAGGLKESIFQPGWSPDGRLYFASDRTGWWNLYRLNDLDGGEAEALHPMEAEFGLPMWAFGMSTYAFASAETILCLYTSKGIWHLARLDTRSGQLASMEMPYTVFGGICADGRRAILTAASSTRPAALVLFELSTNRMVTLRRTTEVMVDPGFVSVAEPIEFPTEHGLTAYALFYPPRNRDYAGLEGEKPPLIVMSHGGPTAATEAGFNLSIQYWTSRGFAVVDVNYGGSTGYGRPYRERLNGQWGVVDVDDSANAAKYLAEQGRVDGDRLAIRGGSAGGYTTLAALTFRDVFKAGASHFGVSDLETLLGETHKFESRYGDSMVGPLPEARETMRERSPIHYTERLTSPVIFFQGLEDRVVPPNQAELMVAALRKNGVPVAYLAFEGEGHGFRKGENIRRTLDAELYFYARVFGFPPPDGVEPVEIENLSPNPLP